MKSSALASRELIRNYSEITSHGLIDMRKDALAAVTAGINAVDPGLGTEESIRLDGQTLQVGERQIPIDPEGKIFIIGSGKASIPIVAALEKILGDRIEEGVLVVKSGESRRLKYVSVLEAAHPLPDDSSVRGAKALLEVAAKAGEKDIVFAAVTGGASSLTTLPPEEIGINDLRVVNDLLLKSGAAIREINTVRRHLCKIKGGRLVAAIQPALAITVTLDTAPKGMPWPDMCLPDESTFADAVRVLQLYKLWQKIPTCVRGYLEINSGQSKNETVKTFSGFRTEIISVGDPYSACQAAADEVDRMGYLPMILSSTLGGEARELGVLLAGMAEEIQRRGVPIRTPCALISGGETIVTIDGLCGRGGPNQESLLGFATAYEAEEKAVFVSIDTDGTDGPTDVAGGIVDSLSMSRFTEAGECLGTALRNHDSLTALETLKDAIITGHTGTNVMNLRILLLR